MDELCDEPWGVTADAEVSLTTSSVRSRSDRRPRNERNTILPRPRNAASQPRCCRRSSAMPTRRARASNTGLRIRRRSVRLRRSSGRLTASLTTMPPTASSALNWPVIDCSSMSVARRCATASDDLSPCKNNLTFFLCAVMFRPLMTLQQRLNASCWHSNSFP